MSSRSGASSRGGATSRSDARNRSGESSKHPPLCYCEVEAFVYTAWTESNAGRRFYGCPYYKRGDIENKDCGFFKWYGDEMCSRSSNIIYGLLKKKNKVEDELKDLKLEHDKLLKKNKWLLKGLVVSWIFILMVFGISML